jgi:hypothetical protein
LQRGSAPVVASALVTRKFVTHEFGAVASVAAPDQGGRHLIDIATHQVAATSEFQATDHGTWLVKGLRVFKSGTFKDSKGIERTWERSHLEQMIFHMNLLKESGLFTDVPMRSDHSESVKDVVGYIDSLYLDPADSTYLMANVEFTEEAAFQKWQRRTWRSRSLEVGMYETNDSALFWPVAMGLAWVDIGAVEGLHGKAKDVQTFSQTVVDDPKEINVDPEQWAAAANYAKALEDWTTAAEFAKACEDWEAAVLYAKALDDQMLGAAPPAAPPADPPPADHQRPQPVQFRVAGQVTADPAAVQAHIDTLEQFRSETTQTNRADFVNGLVRDNKIAAPQEEALTALAQTMTTEQFDAFRASYKDAPSISLFGKHGSEEGGTPPPPGGDPDALSDVEQAKEIVAQHRRAGMAVDKLYRTPSFGLLVKNGIEEAPAPSTDR